MEELRSSDPETIGPYTLVARLGSGGMGVVFLAQNGTQAVALKVVRSSYLDNQSLHSRFIREIETLKRIDSPQAAKILDYAVEQDIAWHAVEYVSGLTLKEKIEREGPLDAGAWNDLAAELQRALEDVHRLGIVHRDIKPANLVMGETGMKLIDFGIAQDDDTTSLTVTGLVAGSPAWLSPERLEGHEDTPASDFFSAGSVLYFAATGRNPWAGSGKTQVSSAIAKIITGVPDLSGLSPVQETVVRGLLRSDPKKRAWEFQISEPPIQEIPSPSNETQPFIEEVPSAPFAPRIAANKFALLALVFSAVTIVEAGAVGLAIGGFPIPIPPWPFSIGYIYFLSLNTLISGVAAFVLALVSHRKNEKYRTLAVSFSTVSFLTALSQLVVMWAINDSSTTVVEPAAPSQKPLPELPFVKVLNAPIESNGDQGLTVSLAQRNQDQLLLAQETLPSPISYAMSIVDSETLSPISSFSSGLGPVVSPAGDLLSTSGIGFLEGQELFSESLTACVLFQIDTGQVVDVFPDAGDTCKATFSPDGTLYYFVQDEKAESPSQSSESGGPETVIRVIDLVSGFEKDSIPLGRNRVDVSARYYGEVLAYGDFLIVGSRGEDDVVTLLASDSGSVLGEITTGGLGDHQSIARDFEISKDGKLLYFQIDRLFENDQVWAIDLESFSLLSTYELPDSLATMPHTISPDGRFLAIGQHLDLDENEHVVTIIDTATKKLVQTISSPNVRGAIFSDDGSLQIAGHSSISTYGYTESYGLQ